MRKTANKTGASWLTMLAVAGLSSQAGVAIAQQAPPRAPESTADEVVVTGSLIRGNTEISALAVDVISAEELQKLGSPTTLELIKDLPVSSGVLGDTNQFDARAQGSEGSGSVNLRGLGSQRTLVLMNGRRLVANPFGQVGTGIVDTNILPSAAIGRIEVLKDGAAATYGSDAIAGVVNFITKQDFEGLEASANYKLVDGSDGDYAGNLVWGANFENGNVLVTAGLQHRSELSTKERDWALQPFANNPQGGWSGGNGTTVFFPVNNTTILGGGVLDNGCNLLGGLAVAGPACNFQFTRFDNITEKEDRYQLYSEVNVDLSAHAKFHGEALFSHTNVPDWKTSPSYLALQSPTSIASGGTTPSLPGGYFVPSTNPGYVAYLAANPGAFPGGANGAYIPGVRFRPYALGGNPLFGNGSSEGTRRYDAGRVSGGVSGDFGNGVNYDFAMTYSQETGIRQGSDALVDRLQLALRGYGSLNSDTTGGCTAAETANYTTNAGNAALGCYWFNPFSNSIQTSAVNGATNPNFSPSLANSADLTAWFFQKGTTKATQRLFTADALFSGDLNFSLPGGEVGWALGAQYRRNFYEITNSDLYNLAATPCIDTPFNGSTNCAVKNGPFLFLGGGASADLVSNVYAAFGELQLPFSDRFNVSVAARYEDYGNLGGSTFNPKISGKFDITDSLSIRGSAGSTFRAPAITNVAPGFVTGFSFIGGSFRAIDFFGNPKLESEKADTYSAGLIFKTSNFKASLDYWRFNFDNPIVSESSDNIVTALFPNPTGAPTGNCAVPSFAGLVSRFTFGNGVCDIRNISRLRVNTVNGGAVVTDGVDLLLDWRFDNVLGGDLGVGTTATYTMQYKVGALSVESIPVSAAFDAAGKLNYQTTAYPLPQLKGSVYGEYTNGPHNVRVTANYVDSYTDQRGAITGPGKEIDSNVTVDVAYRALLPGDTTFTFAVDNIADEDPSFARLDLNYDPFTGSPYGRTVKAGLTKKF